MCKANSVIPVGAISIIAHVVSVGAYVIATAAHVSLVGAYVIADGAYVCQVGDKPVTVGAHAPVLVGASVIPHGDSAVTVVVADVVVTY